MPGYYSLPRGRLKLQRASHLDLRRLAVIAGLDPAIHRSKESCEARWMRGSSPRMTIYYADLAKAPSIIATALATP